MFEDRKIKKAIREKIKPKLSYDEFCRKYDIKEYTAEIKQGDTKVKANVWTTRIGAIFMCCCLAAVIIALILINIGHSSPVIKLYGASNAKLEQMSHEDIVDCEVPFLVDFDRVTTYGAGFKVTPTEDDENPDLLLGYYMPDIIYDMGEDDDQMLYRMTLNIRCYEGYLFAGFTAFDDLQHSYGENCKYTVTQDGEQAYVYIKKYGYEYFIFVEGIIDATPITQAGLESLIQTLI